MNLTCPRCGTDLRGHYRDRARKAVLLRKQGLTFGQVGKALDISPSRANQLVHKAVRQACVSVGVHPEALRNAARERICEALELEEAGL